MRLGTTVTDADSLATHLALGSYSQLLDRVERLGEESARAELDAVASQLDPGALSVYLAARRRNHAINSAAVRLVADGAIDHLILAQEDSGPVGIHIPELLALRAQVEEFRVAGSVAIHPGADEVGMVLMARHHHGAAGRALPVAIDYASPEGAAAIPLFEHQPILRTIESQLHAAGARLVPIGDADAVLFVHTPIQVQRDIAEAPPPGRAPILAAQAESVVERTKAANDAGLLVGLADLAYANGADPELIAALKRSGGASHLSAYAGWNTAANTLGTVIAQLCLTASNGLPVPAAGAVTDFLACRFVDDYGYQACVRSKAAQQAQEMRANPFALGEAGPAIERFTREELKPFAHEAYSDLLGAGSELAERVQVSLPWGRLFEVEVEVDSGDSTRESEKKRS